jgi:hypothetical protein
LARVAALVEDQTTAIGHEGVPVRILSVDVGSATSSGRQKRVVTIRVKLAQPQESMRITVVVPEEGDERLAREHGIARAMDAARQFLCALGADELEPVRKKPAAGDSGISGGSTSISSDL